MARKVRGVVELDNDGYKVYTYSSVGEFMKATNCKNSADTKVKLDGVHFMYEDEYEQRQKFKELKARLIKDVCKEKQPEAKAQEEPAELLEPEVVEVHKEVVEVHQEKQIITGLDLIERRNMCFHLGEAIMHIEKAHEATEIGGQAKYLNEAIYILQRYRDNIAK